MRLPFPLPFAWPAMLPLWGLLVLGGCAPGPWGAVAGVELASVTVFGRGVVDMGVSAVTGRDCSIVRLDRGQSYCAAPDVIAPEVACTRSLGVVDCWAEAPPGPLVGDTPGVSRAQRQHRAAAWPRALTTVP